jgi:MOSC domain-containing protein YiiM
LTGRAVAFGPKGEPSAMHKSPASGALHLGRLGFAGDEQGDPVHHGGVDMAIHHYPFDHYASWASQHGELANVAGAAEGRFGENISTTGWTEKDICIGDIFRIGSATVQVSQGRQPCWKLNVRFGWNQMAAQVQKSGRTGWYYRVLTEGPVAAGDEMALIERPHPDFTLPRLQAAFYVKTLDQAELGEIAALDVLSDSWRSLIRHRLDTRSVEDWSKRLGT